MDLVVFPINLLDLVHETGAEQTCKTIPCVNCCSCCPFCCPKKGYFFSLWQYDISEIYSLRLLCLNSSYPRAYLSLWMQRAEEVISHCRLNMRLVKRWKAGLQIHSTVWTAGLTVDCSPLGASQRWTLYVSKLYVHTDLCSGLSTQKNTFCFYSLP